MKKIKFIVVSLLAGVLLSCSNEADVLTNAEMKDGQSSASGISEIHFLKESNVLSFANIDAFKQVVNQLENEQRSELKTKANELVETNHIPLQIEGFKSIYDEYEEALNEADNYYDSFEHYTMFKEKHPSLFFPEHGDDYSAYLPVSSKSVAKLLNTNGEIQIGNEIVNMKDVTSYDQLVALGETMSDDNISTADYSGNYLNGTPELKNGGDRKLKVRVYTKPGSLGVGEEIIVDVSFRKKGAFGAWYNYKSTTTLGWVNGLSWSKSGFSSHDYKFARVITNQGPLVFKGQMYVDYQGFRGERVFFNVDI